MAASPHVEVIQNWIEQRSSVRGNLQGMPFGTELKIELIEAGAHQRPIMENLLQLYIHDFSEMVSLEIGEDGRYEYKDLNRYWSDPGRWPFLAKLGGKLAGLVWLQLPAMATAMTWPNSLCYARTGIEG